MQCKAFPVVQKEQGSVWLYALERARDVLVMDGADAELVADAVFCAHEFRSRQMNKVFSNDADVLKNKSISICRKPDMYLKCLRLKK